MVAVVWSSRTRMAILRAADPSLRRTRRAGFQRSRPQCQELGIGLAKGAPVSRHRGSYAVPATPIRLPSGSVKWPTTRPVGARTGVHLALAAEAFSLLHGGLHVRNADVADHVAC